jgi:hypothetical protein
MLRTLGFAAVPLHGQLTQTQGLGALGKFKIAGRNISAATDVASWSVIGLHLYRPPYSLYTPIAEV